jgi:hypothetical protein
MSERLELEDLVELQESFRELENNKAWKFLREDWEKKVDLYKKEILKGTGSYNKDELYRGALGEIQAIDETIEGINDRVQILTKED